MKVKAVFLVSIVAAMSCAMAGPENSIGSPEGVSLIDPVTALRGRPELYKLGAVHSIWYLPTKTGWRSVVVLTDNSRIYGVGDTQTAALIDALRNHTPDPKYNPVLF